MSNMRREIPSTLEVRQALQESGLVTQSINESNEISLPTSLQRREELHDFDRNVRQLATAAVGTITIYNPILAALTAVAETIIESKLDNFEESRYQQETRNILHAASTAELEDCQRQLPAEHSALSLIERELAQRQTYKRQLSEVINNNPLPNATTIHNYFYTSQVINPLSSTSEALQKIQTDLKEVKTFLYKNVEERQRIETFENLHRAAQTVQMLGALTDDKTIATIGAVTQAGLLTTQAILGLLGPGCILGPIGMLGSASMILMSLFTEGSQAQLHQIVLKELQKIQEQNQAIYSRLSSDIHNMHRDTREQFLLVQQRLSVVIHKLDSLHHNLLIIAEDIERVQKSMQVFQRYNERMLINIFQQDERRAVFSILTSNDRFFRQLPSSELTLNQMFLNLLFWLGEHSFNDTVNGSTIYPDIKPRVALQDKDLCYRLGYLARYFENQQEMLIPDVFYFLTSALFKLDERIRTFSPNYQAPVDELPAKMQRFMQRAQATRDFIIRTQQSTTIQELFNKHEEALACINKIIKNRVSAIKTQYGIDITKNINFLDSYKEFPYVNNFTDTTVPVPWNQNEIIDFRGAIASLFPNPYCCTNTGYEFRLAALAERLGLGKIKMGFGYGADRQELIVTLQLHFITTDGTKYNLVMVDFRGGFDKYEPIDAAWYWLNSQRYQLGYSWKNWRAASYHYPCNWGLGGRSKLLELINNKVHSLRQEFNNPLSEIGRTIEQSLNELEDCNALIHALFRLNHADNAFLPQNALQTKISVKRLLAECESQQAIYMTCDFLESWNRRLIQPKLNFSPIYNWNGISYRYNNAISSEKLKLVDDAIEFLRGVAALHSQEPQQESRPRIQ